MRRRLKTFLVGWSLAILIFLRTWADRPSGDEGEKEG